MYFRNLNVKSCVDSEPHSDSRNVRWMSNYSESCVTDNDRSRIGDTKGAISPNERAIHDAE